MVGKENQAPSLPRPRLFCRTRACSSVVHEILDASLLCDSCSPCCRHHHPHHSTTTAPPCRIIHTYTNSQDPSRDTRKSQPILPRTPHASTAAPVLFFTTSSCPVAFGFCTQLARPPALLAPTGLPWLDLCATLNFSSRPPAPSRCIARPSYRPAWLVSRPLPSPPFGHDLRSWRCCGLLLWLFHDAALLFKSGASAHDFGPGEREPDLCCRNKVHSQLPRCLTRQCCNSTPQPAAEVPLTCPQAANLEYAQIDQAASHSIAVGNWLYRIATRLAHTPRPPTTQDLHLQAPCTLPPAGSVQVPRGYLRLVAIPDQRAAVRLVVVC